MNFPDLSTWAVAFAALALAYTTFGLFGFGSALIAAPLMAHVMPIPIAISLLALLDLAASLSRGIRLNQDIAWREVKLLLPAMVIGNALGAFVIFAVRQQFLLLFTGLFVTGYACYSLILARLSCARTSTPVSHHFALLYGAIGGIFSAMFGSGGFLYAIYLNRRLDSTQVVRATQSVVISFSALVRVAIFALGSVYYSRSFWLFVLLLTPAMFIGERLGQHLSTRLSVGRYRFLLYFFLLLSGGSLIARYIAEAR